ncbi:MAG: DUF3127 domain-containing protein [Prevotellaceae bacterium]|jgi:hypothetical protein|nr:DUF3127 domain-containing protein [Prevotellaceae bacterium]
MALDIAGILIQKLDIKSGEGARGAWKIQDVIIETIEQYPRKICISFWNEKISDLDKIKLGDKITVSVNIDSREANGRWFTSIRAWRIQLSDENADQQQASASQPANSFNNIPTPTSSDFIDISTDEIDDLPF